MLQRLLWSHLICHSCTLFFLFLFFLFVLFHFKKKYKINLVKNQVRSDLISFFYKKFMF